jgi:hypothetical protein
MRKRSLSVLLTALIATVGAAIADDGPAVPYLVGEIQITAQNPVGLVPEGLRIDGHTSWVITEGIFTGTTGTSIDYLLIRPDGVGILDIRSYGVDPDGTPIAMTAKGFLGDPTLMPPIDAWLDPGFEAPDVDIPLHGAAWFQTMAPQYAFVNHTVFGFSGTLNPATGRIRLLYRSLAE